MSTCWQKGVLLCILTLVSLRCEDQVVASESGDYLFLTWGIVSRQSILDGDPRYIPSVVCIAMPGPGFAFDPGTKSLRIYGQSSFAIDPELQSIVWLKSDGLFPPRGLGGCPGASALPVTHVPLQIDQNAIFSSIEADGAAYVVIKGQLVRVEADSDYQTYLGTQVGGGYYHIPPDTTRYKFVIEQVDSLKIHNYGWCPRRLVSFEGS
jgi:hypothetical protein